MKRKGLFFVVLMTSLLSGCVWSTEYKAKLAELDGLQQQRSALEEKLRATEKELADMNRKYDELLNQKNALADENAAIRSTLEAKRGQLAGEVVDLKTQLAGSSGRIKALEDELKARNVQVADLQSQRDQLSREKAAAVEEKEKAIASMKNTYESLMGELKQEIKAGEIQITQLRDKLTVNMVEKILFDSGSAVIKKNGRKVLDRVADIL